MPIQKTVLRLQPTLQSIQLRLSVMIGRRLTHGDLALIAGVKLRSVGQWMRGSTSPASGEALLRLLSALPVDQLQLVLEPWKTDFKTVLAAKAATTTKRARRNARSTERKGSRNRATKRT
jgi:hypothetical protein